MRGNSKRNCDGIIDQKGNGNRDKLSWKVEGEGEGDAWWAKGKVKGGKRMRAERGKGKRESEGEKEVKEIYVELIDWIHWFGNEYWLYVPIICTSYVIDVCIILQTEMLFR